MGKSSKKSKSKGKDKDKDKDDDDNKSVVSAKSKKVPFAPILLLGTSTCSVILFLIPLFAIKSDIK